MFILNAFDRMAKEDNITGFEFEDLQYEIAAAWHISAFVDDTNKGVAYSSGSQFKATELVETLGQAGQMWENLLHNSGGALNLLKCVTPDLGVAQRPSTTPKDVQGQSISCDDQRFQPGT